jgi:hypothetical protein
MASGNSQMECNSSSNYAVKFLNILFCREGFKTLTSCQDTSAYKPKLYNHEIPSTELPFYFFDFPDACLYGGS